MTNKLVPKSIEILERLQQLHPKQIDLSLDRLMILLKKLGNPHLKVPPTIHIAGTNGKGSTATFLRYLLHEQGYSTHTYTSPHLIKFNERIRINSKLISNQYLMSLLEECEKNNLNRPITFFEITTAAAILAFSRVSADFLILETGLGGRFDATNIVENKICNVITPISMDHMGFLGNSIRSITNEKIGILRSSVQTVISPQKNIVSKIIEKFATEKDIVLYSYGKKWKIIDIDEKKNKFKFQFLEEIENYTIPDLFGRHQIFNSAAALVVLKIITKNKINKTLVDKAFKKTEWPARMQKLSNGPLNKLSGERFELWVDGGHNDEAGFLLAQTLKKWKKHRLFLILGMIKGKTPKKFLDHLIQFVDCTIIIPVEGHHFIPPKKILNYYKYSKKNILERENVEQSIQYISSKYSEGKIIICGSLYLAGAVLKKNNFKIV